jgi:hypothetical protein
MFLRRNIHMLKKEISVHRKCSRTGNARAQEMFLCRNLPVLDMFVYMDALVSTLGVDWSCAGTSMCRKSSCTWTFACSLISVSNRMDPRTVDPSRVGLVLPHTFPSRWLEPRAPTAQFGFWWVAPRVRVTSVGHSGSLVSLGPLLSVSGLTPPLPSSWRAVDLSSPAQPTRGPTLIYLMALWPGAQGLYVINPFLFIIEHVWVGVVRFWPVVGNF